MISLKEQKLEILKKYGLIDENRYAKQNVFYDIQEISKAFDNVESDLKSPDYDFIC